MIDGPIALSIATKNKKQNIVETLLEHGVPPLPHNEVPNFFYDNEINNLFDFKTLPIIAYTQMPIPEDSSTTPKPLNVNIYQLKVAKQCGVLEDYIQEQLKEAAQKLGGTPEDHKNANPIYGGSCGYHAIKNAMLGLMVLSDYDKLAEST